MSVLGLNLNASQAERGRSIPPSRNGAFLNLGPSLRYLFTPEVHVYAYSIAANALLSFFPFSLLLLTLCARVLHWQAAYDVILQWLRANLPAGASFVIRNLVALVAGRGRLQVISLLMLSFTCSGVFLPLEIALNRVWHFRNDRSFFRNAAVSFAITLAAGLLVLATVALTATADGLVHAAIGGVPSRGALALAYRVILEMLSLPCVVSILFIIYYFLPNGKVPWSHALGAAFLAALASLAGKFAYLISLPMFRFREVYGPFAISATLLLWAFGGAMVLLWGARLSAQVSVEALESSVKA
jgi:membrane protein